ncbi:MAG: T9SS type A sorting domain-containing protein [Saprospiraceae bacterium]
MNVFPNPVSNNRITLRYDLAKSANVSIELLSSTGQVINTIVSSQQKPYGTYWEGVETENLSAGIYFLRINADGISKTERVVIVD